ncbi:MAG TPA: ATP-binding cassette domain-containing protein [Solirubrobacteraceae bacterium]|nr:ATP-binding cassette domain-containing protein [Solirubrobacteraceae bacterium]
MADEAAAIQLDGVGRAYGERFALRDVSVSVPSGATLGVLGPNGAGKSTLLALLATLVRPHTGVARILGHPLPREGWAVRGRIGFIGHEPLLYRQLSGRENLRYHARLHGVDLRRVEALLERVGIAVRADEPVRTLARGMAHRLEVCRAVLHEPELLLLDEPLAHLDPAAVEAVEPLIGRSTRLTRVVTGHDPTAAVADCDLVLGLRDGRAVLSGPAGDVTPAHLGALYR